MGPEGRTPVLDAWARHQDKVSVIGAVSLSPAARRLGFYFATDPDGYFTTAKVVAFLRDLLRHLRGEVVVVWDGGSNHRGPVMRAFLARNRRLRLERLPAYSPDLNPVEAVWSWLKYGQLSNFVQDNVHHLDERVVERLFELKCNPRLLRQLWSASELPFPNRYMNSPDNLRISRLSSECATTDCGAQAMTKGCSVEDIWPAGRRGRTPSG